MTVRPLPSPCLDEPVTAGAAPDRARPLAAGRHRHVPVDRRRRLDAAVGSRSRRDGRRDRAALRDPRRGDRGAQRRATGRTRRRRQRGRRVRSGVRRAGGRVGRAAPAARPRPGRKACSSRCGWRSTPARPSCATKGTTSGPRSSAAPGCERSAPAARCWSRARPPTSSVIGSRRTRRSPTSGLHRLKDLGRPERVFELRHPGSRRANAPLRSLDNLPNNLPVQLTSFVGRARRARRAARAAGVDAAPVDHRRGRLRQDAPRRAARGRRARSVTRAARGSSSSRRVTDPERVPRRSRPRSANASSAAISSRRSRSASAIGRRWSCSTTASTCWTRSRRSPTRCSGAASRSR